MKKIIKIFLSFVIAIAILYGIIIWIVFLQYNFGENLSNKKPLSENEIFEKNYENSNFDYKNIEFSKEDIIKKIPFDKNIFTQGIFVENEKIFVTSGNPNNLPNTKTILWILWENGIVETKIHIENNNFFGEWATKFDEKIFWTFWKNKKIFIYDEKNYEKIWEFDIEGEGWGLTSDGENLILSDWSEFLTFFDKNLEITKKIIITENKEKINKINELEFIDGLIFANIWLTNDIVIIEPKTGEIITRKNFNFLKEIEKSENPNAQEMNGIAFNKEKNEIIITGKMWENLYIFKLEKFLKNKNNL